MLRDFIGKGFIDRWVMTDNAISFPYDDKKPKVIALVGYTGVGKTSLITAGYFENIFYGKDAFTQRFFQRIEDDMRTYGEVPLTMGEASTLNFIEPESRSEFNIQDFSGEHIKLGRADEKKYHDLIARADDAHALICMISAANFYRNTQIYEEIDAIQSFVNRLRGLGTRIPVVVVLTKCDTVPRFYVDIPILKSIFSFISSLPFFSINPSKGLALTKQRFPKIFSGLDFKGKGPRTTFLGVALPRLAYLKAWRWPKGFQWLAKLLRKFFIDPQYIFKKHYQLTEAFYFCFQAFQLSVLRNMLISHHEKKEDCDAFLKEFHESMIEKNNLGKEFYFKEYFDRIVEDTKSLIHEMQEEVASLSASAGRLLIHERDLAQNLQIWLQSAEDKMLKFNKPWSEGAKKTLEELQHNTLCQVRDRIQEWIDEIVDKAESSAFYRLIDILRLRRDISKFDIWRTEEIQLPEVEPFQQKLFEYFLTLTLSRSEVSSSIFQEDRDKYLEVLTITPPQELEFFEAVVNISVDLHKNLSQQEAGSGNWQEQVLKNFKDFETAWLQLSKHCKLSAECEFRRAIESKVLKSLQKESEHFKSLSQILEWTLEVEQLLHCENSQQILQNIVEATKTRSNELLSRELDELNAKAEKSKSMENQIPSRLKEWFTETQTRRESIELIAGSKGTDALEGLQKEVLSDIRDLIQQKLKTLLEEGKEKLGEKGDRSIFVQIIEFLHIYHEIETDDIFSRCGLALPSTEDIKKLLFQHLVLIIVSKAGLNLTFYEEDKARFMACIKGKAAHLESLDQLVKSFEELNNISKIISSLPVSEWENKIFQPMRNFYQSWLELAGHLQLPSESVVRKKAEQICIRSLKDNAESIELRQLRDWVALLTPMLQTEEHHKELDQLLISTEENIRTHFHTDLESFVIHCKELENASSCLKIKEYEKVEDNWESFSGSVQTLSLSTKKFPHSELSLNEDIQNLLEKEAPENFEKSLKTWFDTLRQKKLFCYELCLKMLDSVSTLRKILHRPEAFMSLSKQLEARQKRYLKRKNIMRSILGTAIAALVLLFVSLGMRLYLTNKMKDLEIFEKNFVEINRHEKLALRWQNLFQYPSFLLSSPKTITDKIVTHKTLHYLEQIENKLRLQASSEQLHLWRKQITFFHNNNTNPKIKAKAEELFVEIRTLELYQKQLAKVPTKWLQQEFQKLQEQYQNIKQKRHFKSQMLEAYEIESQKKK